MTWPDLARCRRLVTAGRLGCRAGSAPARRRERAVVLEGHHDLTDQVVELPGHDLGEPGSRRPTPHLRPSPRPTTSADATLDSSRHGVNDEAPAAKAPKSSLRPTLQSPPPGYCNRCPVVSTSLAGRRHGPHDPFGPDSERNEGPASGRGLRLDRLGGNLVDQDSGGAVPGDIGP